MDGPPLPIDKSSVLARDDLARDRDARDSGETAIVLNSAS